MFIVALIYLKVKKSMRSQSQCSDSADISRDM